MRILFIAPTNFGLHEPIIAELQRQEHNIDFINDETLPHDNGFKGKNAIKKYIDNILYDHKKISKTYWDEKLNNYDLDAYDLCLCINGCSLSEYFFQKFRSKNKRVRFILYLWDTLNFFDYSRNFAYFDKIYSFDFNDSHKISGLRFLPFYWIPFNQPVETKYAVSCIGSHHDGRLSIAEKIANQLEENNLNYYFRIICSCNTKLNLTLFKTIILSIIRNDKTTLRDIRILLGKETHPFITPKPYSIDEMIKLIAMSDCVLDTDMQVQAGPTPRLIWALALGKKVITTNQYISQMPLYHKECIYTINRNNPIINIEFIAKHICHSNSEYMTKLRIDNWIKELIN